MDDRSETAGSAVALGEDLVAELRQAVDAVRAKEFPAESAPAETGFSILEPLRERARQGMREMDDVLPQLEAAVNAVVEREESKRANDVEQRVAAIKQQLNGQL